MKMANGKWTAFALGYQTALAYIAAFLINQLGGLLTGELTFGLASIIAFILLAAILYLIFRPSAKIALETEQVTGIKKRGNDMIKWIGENAATIIISALLLMLFILAIRNIISKRKKGGCGCGCGSCPQRQFLWKNKA